MANRTVCGVSILLRVLAIAASLVSSYLMLRNQQTIVIYGFEMTAKYTDAPAFKIIAYANLVAAVFGLLSVISKIHLARNGPCRPNYYFLLFLLDLMILVIVVAACASATAIGEVGKKGLQKAGWLPICYQFPLYCQGVSRSLALSYVAIVCFFALSVLSAFSSRHPHHRPANPT